MKYLELLAKSPGVMRGGIAALLMSVGTGFTINANLSPQQAEKVATTLSPSQSQRDNYIMQHRSCNSSANAMWLNYFRAFNFDKERQGFVKDDVYLSSVLKRGDTTEHWVQTEALKAYGVDSYWDTTANLAKFRTALAEGFPVVVNLLHRGKVGDCGSGNVLKGGHVVLVRSSYVRKDSVVMLKVSDPYGQLCANYEDYATEYEITLDQFKKRWQGGARYVKKDSLNQVE